MTDGGHERLDHLISRFLDHEASGAERRELNATLNRDPAAREHYEQTAALDREMSRAMRAALGRTLALRPVAPGRFAWTRLIGVAAAAALAALLVLQKNALPGSTARDSTAVQRAGAWGFLPSEAPGDTFAPVSPGYALPHVQFRDTQCNWLLVPAERPGQFLVIEVQRVKTRALGIHTDY